MRWSVVGLAACGRLGFVAPDGTSGADAPTTDTSVDTPIGQVCATDLECGRCARCTGTCQAEPIQDVTLGHRSSCYFGANGDRWCTGLNDEGQLGLGDRVDRSTPERALDGGGWEQVFLFFYGPSRGLRGGQLFEWGGTRPNTPDPVAPHGPVRKALGDTRSHCFWQLDGTAPGCDPSGTMWKSIAFGADHYCGVAMDGSLYCWGLNYDGALGQPAFADGVTQASPLQVGVATHWIEVGAGGAASQGASCARTNAGQIYCWGHPELTGLNGVDVDATPTALPDTDWTWLEMHWQFSCAGKADGSVWCWGRDGYGGYVAPMQTRAAVPTRVPGTYDRWVMGGHHACGRATGTGRWWCFGWNAHGQLGVGHTINDGALVELCP